jgi:hypothetical protein
MRIDSAIITGSFSVNGDTFNDLGVFPSTGSNTFVGNQSIVGAVSASALTGSISYTNLTDVPTLVSGSEQIVSIISPLNSFTASNLTTNTFTSSATARLNSIETITASNVARLTSLESITGSLATTGSNTFIGTQTITGSLFISSNLIVQGTSSLQNITASAVSIGTNLINLNTANPAIRYAGLVIGDSGSVGGSGSFLYDSVQDEMIFIHRGTSTVVTSSVVLMGPQTFDTIGTEAYPTSNIIQKGTGNEHLVDSCIFDNGSTVCVNATLKINGNIGIGATPSTWANGTECSLQIKNASIYEYGSYEAGLQVNAFYNTSVAPAGWKYISTGVQCIGQLQLSGGDLNYNVANPGTAECGITWNNRFNITRCGNVGISTNSPVANDGTSKTLQLGNRLVIQNVIGTQFLLGTNAYYDGAWKYIACAKAQAVRGTGQSASIQFHLSPTGTAGGTITNMDTSDIKMTILETGCVGIGTITPSYRLEICGDGNGTGELAVKGTGTDIGLALNNTGTGGKSWRILSTGGGSGAGNGKLITWDGTGYGWVIDSNRNMGIGTISPNASSPLHVKMCSNSNGDGIRVQAMCTGGAGSQPGIAFANTSDCKRWNIAMDTSSDTLQITNAGGSNVLNITQNCVICTGPVITVGMQGGTDTTLIAGGSGYGSSIRMNYAGGSYNNYLAGNGDNYFNCLLGKLNAAGGIKFGGGSGTLNHYETGTWAPQLYWGNGGNYCMGGINGGNYVRVGNVVHINFHLQWSALCGSSGFAGQLRMGGLPFVVGGYRSAGTISAISYGIGRSGANITWHALTADPGANFIYWIENDATGGYGHSPSVGAAGLVYSNQLTYTLQ